MKKIIYNFCFLIILGLIAQAIFLVCCSNSTITASLKVKKIQAENYQIRQNINALEDKITQLKALHQAENQASSADYISINERQLVLAPILANLP